MKAIFVTLNMVILHMGCKMKTYLILHGNVSSKKTRKGANLPASSSVHVVNVIFTVCGLADCILYSIALQVSIWRNIEHTVQVLLNLQPIEPQISVVETFVK